MRTPARLAGPPIALIALVTVCAGQARPPLGQGTGDRAVHVESAEQPLYEVTRIVDGDTIWIVRDGIEEKLRLLSVDTEEKIGGYASGSKTKPVTVFGEQTTLWAQEFFASLAAPGEAPRVGLRFPEGREERDFYGRLLCHVILPDGRDFNLLLVQQGWSPYFNKYGNSLLDHAAFERAQEAARAARIGIWDPQTNQAKTPGAPSAKRPYADLLPWWQARAEAIEAFRALQSGAGAARAYAADDPDQLALALERCSSGEEKTVAVFGSIDRFFDEEDGTLTVLFRTSRRSDAFRVSLPSNRTPELESFLKTSTQELRQNYLFVEGRVFRGPRGFRMRAGSSNSWRLAGPKPVVPQR